MMSYGIHRIIGGLTATMKTQSPEVVPLLEDVPEERECSYRFHFGLAHNEAETAKTEINLPFIIAYLGLALTPGQKAHHGICNV